MVHKPKVQLPKLLKIKGVEPSLLAQEAKTPYESLMEVWRVKKIYRLPFQQSTPLSFLPASGVHYQQKPHQMN